MTDRMTGSRAFGRPGQGTGRVLAHDLRAVVEHDTQHLLAREKPPFASAFVSRNRQVISDFASPATGLAVVVEGRKEVSWGTERRELASGDALLLSAGTRVDVVNEPDEATGTYRALFLRFPREAMIQAARLWPEFAGSPPDDITVLELSRALSHAILHAGAALTGRSRRVVEHRHLEVLLVLAEQGVMRFAPKYCEVPITDAIRSLIRHRLDRAWSATTVAARLSMSEATLRRRLRRDGQSLRKLLLAERMEGARILLCERDANVAEAAAAAGYASRSHFARHFQATFGMSPSQARMRPPLRSKA